MGWGKLLYIVFAGASSFAAIFGSDTRVLVTPSSAANDLGRRTAVAVLSSLHTETGGILTLAPDKSPLCSGERFAENPALSYACTGFLVSPDLIATAGHCMVNTGEDHNETQTYCQAFAWLFDYQASDAGVTAVTGISSDKLYHCKQVIYAVNEEKLPYRDFALVQLDRPVLDRAPLPIASELSASDALSMIGYPLGGPETLSTGARILLNEPARQSFITNLDAFEGNSGSPVFNASGEVVGILIAGTPVNSLVDDPSGCERVNICDADGTNCLLPDPPDTVLPGFQRTGSEVQRIQPLLDLLKGSTWSI